MVDLPDEADASVGERVGDPDLPERAVALERRRHRALDHLPEIGGGGHTGGAALLGEFLFKAAGFADRAMVLQENAKDGLETLDARFEACFIDLLNSFRSEEITRRVFELCLERLEPGGLLMADNALRQGEVLHATTQQARNVAHYNELVAKHPRLESVVIPIRDGLSVARVKD